MKKSNPRKMHHRLFALSLLAGITLVFTACSPPTPSDASSSQLVSKDNNKEKITICLIPKKKGLPYFTSCAKGAEEAAMELGNVELIYDGPTDGSPEKQASMIEQ